MKFAPTLRFDNLRGDFFGGITAAIVALPLALAFGVSSGAGAIAGLYGAVFVGFFAALFGGTPSQISGPTGPMTVVMATVFTAVARDGSENSVAFAFTIVVLGGLFQILFGVLKLGKYINFIPYTVVSGFMSGVGMIIILLQFGPLIGQSGQGSVVDSLLSYPAAIAHLDWRATLLGLMTLGIVFFYPRRLNRILPAPLTALIVCTALSVLLFQDVDPATLPEGASNLLRIGEIPSALPHITLPSLEFSKLNLALGYGLMLATLGAIDSLLTSLVADNITRTQHNSDKELIGQGIGNVVSGLFGGLPGAGATMRTVINVQAGGKTPISGMIHAFVLLVVVVWAGPLTAQIPQAVLAGILFKVGIDIIDWGFLKRAHKISMKATYVMYGVMLLTVFVDLITAVVLGVLVANILTLQRQAEVWSDEVKAIQSPADDEESLNAEEKALLRDADGRILLFSLGGPMSFGAAKTISRRLSIVGEYDVLILDLSGVKFMGVTASLAVENMVREAITRKRDVYIAGAVEAVSRRLRTLSVLDRIPAGHQLDNRLEALQMAHESIRQMLAIAEELPVAAPVESVSRHVDS